MDSMDKRNNVRVPLQVVMDAVESADNEWNQFLNIETMEAVSVPESLFLDNFGDEYRKLSDMIEEGFNSRFFRLPSPYDIHEYSMMERFIGSLPDGAIRDRLENAIRRRGAFRRFKDGIYRLDMEQEWYDFRENAYREIAVERCEDHDSLSGTRYL